MRLNRIYQNTRLYVGDTIELDQRASHHLINVLRVRTGNNILLFNNTAFEYTATLSQQDKKLFAYIIDMQQVNRESSFDISLTQGICRSDRMDWVIQKSVELGVFTINPVYCKRSVKKPDEKRAKKKQHHWHGIVISACEQSGRCILPILEPAQLLKHHLARHDPSSTAYVLDPCAEKSLMKSIKPADKADILIGPEGGLTQPEIETANNAGYQSVSLGPRILRTETAGVAVLSILQSMLGDLK